MEKTQNNNDGIREYLLGILHDPDLTTQIETKLLDDESFCAELDEAEDVLIEEYLDGELSQAEIEKFESHFLAAPQRRQHLRFNQNLRKIAIREAAAGELADKPAIATANAEPEVRQGWFIPLPAFSFALVVLIVAGFGYGLLRIVLDRSINVDAEIAELAVVYKGTRPLKARITGFDHASDTATRGDDPKTGKALSPEERQINARRELVAGKLEEAVLDDPTAEALYGRGKAYLAAGDPRKAIPLLEQAAAKSPGNALIQSDLGSAYLWMGENGPEMGKVQFMANAQQAFDNAMRTNPKLREPYFNRAYCLQLLGRNDEAKQAWHEYLRLDPDSAWADEAEAQLRKLEEKKTGG